MKPTLFVVLFSLAINCSLGAVLKPSFKDPRPKCPGPSNIWPDFAIGGGSWYVLGRTDETVPRTVYNTIEINNLYPGKVSVLSRGTTRDYEVLSQWDELIEFRAGDFGKSYYELDSEPKSFNVTSSDGKQTQFSMPYYDQTHYTEAVIFSCTQIDESTIETKAWLVSRVAVINPTFSDEVKELVQSLTGKELQIVCQGDFC